MNKFPTAKELRTESDLVILSRLTPIFLDAKEKGKTSITILYDSAVVKILRAQPYYYNVVVSMGNCDHFFCECGSTMTISW